MKLEILFLKVILFDKEIWLVLYVYVLFISNKKVGVVFNYKDGCFYLIEELCFLYSIKKYKVNLILIKGNEVFE